MRADVTVLAKPLVDDDLRLESVSEPLGIEHFASQCAVEPLVVAVLPW